MTNCHPHPIGIDEREQQKSSREAEEISISVLEGRTAVVHDSRSASYPGTLLPPPTISDPLTFSSFVTMQIAGSIWREKRRL